MFDWVPIQVWLLIPIGLVSYTQARYVYEYLVNSPSRREITEPSEDLSWRTPRQFTKSLSILVVLIALTIFIFTPAAAEFANSQSFWPLMVTGMAGSAAYWAIAGIATGMVEPLMRGDFGPYARQEQPRKYWASLTWNIVFAGVFAWMAFNMWTNPDWVW